VSTKKSTKYHGLYGSTLQAVVKATGHSNGEGPFNDFRSPQRRNPLTLTDLDHT